MKFSLDVQYLGMQCNTLQDGSSYYSVSFYSQDDGPLTLNVGEKNTVLLNKLGLTKFGTLLTVTVGLFPRDKLYRLGLIDVKENGK